MARKAVLENHYQIISISNHYKENRHRQEKRFHNHQCWVLPFTNKKPQRKKGKKGEDMGEKSSHWGKKCEILFVCLRCKMSTGSNDILKATVDEAITTHLASHLRQINKTPQIQTINWGGESTTNWRGEIDRNRIGKRETLFYHGNPVRSWYESSNEITCRVNRSWFVAPAPIISCPKSWNPNPWPPAIESSLSRVSSESRSVGVENNRDWKRPNGIGGRAGAET